MFEIFTLEIERELLGLKDIDNNEKNENEILTEEIPQIKDVSSKLCFISINSISYNSINKIHDFLSLSIFKSFLLLH